MVTEATRIALLASLIVGGGCSSNAAAAVALGTAAALAETAAYRSSTGYRCWAECTNGTACNERTQMCEPIPCGGSCPEGQACDESSKPAQCVGVAVPLKINRDEPVAPLQGAGEARRTPADPLGPTPPAP